MDPIKRHNVPSKTNHGSLITGISLPKIGLRRLALSRTFDADHRRAPQAKRPNFRLRDLILFYYLWVPGVGIDGSMIDCLTMGVLGGYLNAYLPPNLPPCGVPTTHKCGVLQQIPTPGPRTITFLVYLNVILNAVYISL